MPHTPTPDRDALRGVPDLPLVIEQLQDQLDELRATVEAQQVLLQQHVDRIAALERLLSSS